ncbi:hypothetical protein TrLO_g11697 [Triparma laevis f. longispina]|uniref:WW domain-containing protein n=1 Tax=Triparma laevis f. longispina TaxID=1714387 RepID=A0A9W7C8M8_9STRA|nr:hypothetical protein TrLO_g11697 [Triparma laevis f. longispina]
MTQVQLAGKYSPAGASSCSSSCPAGTHASTTPTACINCPAGKFIGSPGGTSESSCTSCEAGKFNESQGSISCTDCDSGKFSPTGVAVCTSCDAGKYSASGSSEDNCLDYDAGMSSPQGSTSCSIVCSSGSYSPVGSPCINCEPGKFNENEHQESCTTCGSGRYNPSTGSKVESECRNCEAGKASTVDVRVTTCDACPLGKAAPAPGLVTCSTCAAGTYSNDPAGATICELCAVGKYTGAAQSTSCDPCEPGTFNLVSGSVTCGKCAGGEKINANSDGCDTCPEGTYSNPGSSICTDCVHTDGYVSLAGSNTCEYCGPGFYADQASNTCKECPINSFSVGGVNACEVRPSGTNNAMGSTACSPCPPGTITTSTTCQQCEQGKYAEFGATSCSPCQSGQYADEVGLAACKTCKICGAGKFTSSACFGNSETECVDCLKGTASMGGECLTGKYYDEPSSECKLCPSGKFTATGGVGIWQCSTCDVGFYSSDPGASNCLTCDPGKYTNEEQTACLSCPAGKISGVAGSECTVCDTGKFAEKEGSVECQLCNTEEVLKGSITAGDGTTSVSGCICPKGKYLNHETSTCDVVFKGVKKTVENMNVTRLNLEKGFWRTATDSSEVLMCLCFDLNFPPAFTKFLSFTSSIVNLDFLNLMPLGCITDSDFHRTLVMMTLGPFILGLLIILAYKLFKAIGQKSKANETFGWFLFMTFAILPSVSTKVFSTFACREFDSNYGGYLKMDYSINCDSAEHKFYSMCAWLLLRLEAALEERKRLEEENEDLQGLLFLYGSFEPMFWWFEILDTIRKLVLTGGLIFLGPGTTEQIAISMIICLAALRIFSGFKPFIKDSHDQFSEVAQWQVFFVMLSAMMIKTKIDSGGTIEEQGFYDYMLLAIQFIAPAMMVYIGLKKGREVVVRRLTRGESAARDVERGLELASAGRVGGGRGGGGEGMVLGDGVGGQAANNPILLDFSSKTGKAAGVKNCKPLSSFDSYNRRGGAGKGKKKQEALDHMNAPKRESEIAPRNKQPAMPKLLDYCGATNKKSETAPLPPTRPSIILPPQTHPPTSATDWTKHWSDDDNEFYYLSEYGETQWEKPKGYVEE